MKTLASIRNALLTVLFFLFILSTAKAQTPPSDLNGEALKTWLVANYFTGKHQTLGYSTARMYLYNYIDNENGKITCVYSGYEVNSAYGGTTTYPAPINCEHTIPQSFFGEADPMVSDLHHLYPTYENWNSTRSNYPFAEIDDNNTAKWMYLDQSLTTIPTSNIDLYSEYANSTFEPREDHKGNVARSIFYFYTMYPTQAGNISQIGDINTFYQWHLNDPVDAAEIERNGQIETYQGDRNPYVDHPDLVARAFGFATIPSVPAAPVLQLAATSSAINLSWTNVSDENGYRIYKSASGGSYSLLSSPGANSTSYSDNNVSQNITYSYYIIAYNAEGNSNASNIVTGQIQSSGNGTATELLISEYVEGSSYNKAIEIANFTGNTVNLANFSLKKQSNGAGDWASELTLSGNLTNGDVYVIVYSQAGTTLKAMADLVTTSAALSFNGNDAVGLFKNGTLTDVVGIFNSTANFGKDVTLVRNLNITSPNTNYVTNEWTSYSIDVFTNLGTHEIDGGTAPDTQAPTAPANLIASNITQTTLSLSWNASSDNIGVTGYDVYRGTTKITTVTSTSFNVTGLSANTAYSFYVKAKDAAGNISASSNTINVTTLNNIITYCTSQGNNASYEWIAGVVIGTFSNTSGSAKYTDFTSKTVNIGTGNTSVSLTPGFSGSTYNEYWKIWIDLNKDGDFDDAGELVYDAGALSKTTVSGTMVVPTSAAGVTSRMRVSMKYNAAQTACESFSYGEVEDYTVSIAAGVPDTQAPSAPTNLVASNITTSSLSLNWNNSTDNVGVTSYDVYRNGSYLANTATNNYNVSGLLASTTYSFYVKAKDAAGNVSSNSNTATVTTSSQTLTYCASKGNNSSYEWIDLVQLGSMTNATGNNGGYADFTSKIADAKIGSNTIYYSCGFSSSSYTEYWHVWIDFNHDGDFEDSGEQVVTTTSSSSSTLSSTFTIPAGTLTGNTRMRVTMKYAATATPCETFTYGEVEDYTINISNASQNNPPLANFDNLEIIDYSIYPSPAEDYTNLYLSCTDDIEDVTIRIIDLQGRILITEKHTINATEMNTRLDLTKLNSGLYIVHVNSNTFEITEKLRVQ